MFHLLPLYYFSWHICPEYRFVLSSCWFTMQPADDNIINNISTMWFKTGHMRKYNSRHIISSLQVKPELPWVQEIMCWTWQRDSWLRHEQGWWWVIGLTLHIKAHKNETVVTLSKGTIHFQSLTCSPWNLHKQGLVGRKLILCLHCSLEFKGHFFSTLAFQW